MRLRSPVRAFSLVEVIIAVGLFATAITVVLGLLSAVSRQAAATADAMTAARLPDALKCELTRLAAPGFDALAARLPALGPAAGEGLAFVATRDAARLHSRDYLPPAAGVIRGEEQHFLLECWRFPDEPLRYEPSKHSLALAVRVSWPYRLPGISGVVPESNRTQLFFSVALKR